MVRDWEKIQRRYLVILTRDALLEMVVKPLFRIHGGWLKNDLMGGSPRVVWKSCSLDLCFH
jgi:hypothetical protein